ncbi:MAG: NADH-quinone oxidoreductase subunit NuoH [Planctomycetota bacterium]|nr:MAG: NADH-quinone oxidoreductase subunit NuoH [Planctomycetota bacterium]
MNISIWNILVAVGVVGLALQIVPGLIWAERKVCARIQGRRGPNRVGPFGLLQPVADAIKLLTKEEIVPAGVDKPLYYLGPFLVFVPAALAMAVVPWGHDMVIGGQRVPLQVAELHVGVLFVLACTSLGVYGIAFGGWASNSKYPLLAALRSSAQMISYEVAMGLAVVAVVMTAGSVDLREIVAVQQGTWFGVVPQWLVFKQPIAALLFLVAAFAENNRLPFDLPEAESELVGGYHTEYSGMKFAMFFLGEYVAMITMSAVLVTLFFGGWGFPGLVDPSSTSVGSALLSFAVFLAKVSFFLFFYLWVRWTLPRFRYDQLMMLGWKALIPLALFNVVATGFVGIL